MSTTAQVFLDEIEVTGYSVEGSSTRRLNRPAVASVKLPMQHAIGGAGSLMKVYFDGVLHHHGRVLNCETTADENTGYTVYNSSDPFELWQWRPVRDPGQGFTSSCGKTPPVDDPGDFSDPTIVQDFQTGPEIVEAMMYASENIALGPDDAEGPLFLANGSFACGGTPLTGTPKDWPMTMAQLTALLISTGEVDLIITPIELDANGNYGQLDAYNGDYGNDLSSSVAFQYGMGAFNIRSLRWNEDMTNMTNKLWKFLGQKVAQQRWEANITGDAVLAYPPGGALSPPASATNNQVGVRNYSSRNVFGVRMDIQIDDAEGAATLGYDLYKRSWQVESWLRALPKNIIHVTPTRDTEIGTFDIGDLVLVEAVPAVKGGFSGAQRIYEYTVSWTGPESVCELGELQVSSDAEGFST